MPGTIVEDVELIDAGHGGGNPPPAGGDDDGDSSGSQNVRYRAALISRPCSWAWPPSSCSSWRWPVRTLCERASASIGRARRCPGFFGSTQRYCSQVASPSRWRVRSWRAASAKQFRFLVVGDHRARIAFPGRADHCLAPARRRGNVAGHQSQQQFFLSPDRRARCAPGRRNFGIVLRGVPAVEPFADLAVHGCRVGFDLLALHGWAVDFSARTSDSGTVNRA